MSIDTIAAIVGYITNLPIVGTYVANAVIVLVSTSAVVTTFVALWHALILFIDAVGVTIVLAAQIPGLSWMLGIATALERVEQKLRTKQDEVGGFITLRVLPILNRLSTIPLPRPIK